MPIYCIELTVKITFIFISAPRHWLEDSGWTNALVQAEIASSGTADLFTKATHVTKTLHPHEVTAACLYALTQRAYTDYFTSVGPNQNEANDKLLYLFKNGVQCEQINVFSLIIE